MDTKSDTFSKWYQKVLRISLSTRKYFVYIHLQTITFKIVPLHSNTVLSAFLPLLEHVLEAFFSKHVKRFLRFMLDICNGAIPKPLSWIFMQSWYMVADVVRIEPVALSMYTGRCLLLHWHCHINFCQTVQYEGWCFLWLCSLVLVSKLWYYLIFILHFIMYLYFDNVLL